MFLPVFKRIKLLFIGFLGSLFIRILFSTIRIEERPHNYPRKLINQNKKIIYAIWHPFMLTPGYVARNLGIKVLISQHSDGEYIAQVIKWLGYSSVRGSTTRGGGRALLAIIKKAREWKALAITPDGPKGPVFHAQPGIIFLGQKTGYPIIPLSLAYSNYWTLPSWDKFRVPKPFSYAVVNYGKPITIPRRLEKSEVEEYRLLLEKTLNDMMVEAERLVKVPGRSS